MSDERVTVRLTYAGRRMPPKRTDSKPIHLWVAEDGAERVYGFGGAAVGGVYTFECPASEPTSVYKGTQTWTGEQCDDSDQVAAWQLEDASTMQALGRRAAEKRLAKSNELDEALEPLLRIVRRLRTRHDVYAVSAYVSERIVETFWKER